MADTSLNASIGGIRPGIFARGIAAIADVIHSFAVSGRKMRQFEALWALNDAELAKRGLKRNQIAQYVFLDNDWA